MAENISTMALDSQIQALMHASGHTMDDTILILNELNKIGWTVRPMTGLSSRENSTRN